MDSNYSLSDIAVATRGMDGNDGMFGGNGIWFLALLLLFGMGGYGGYGARGQAATTEDLASGFNFNSLQGKTNDILAAINGVNQNLGNAICTSTYELGGKIDSCCCATQRAIDSVKFDLANYSASTNAAIAANTQKVLDKMAADKEAALNARIQSLELQQALCGVPRLLPGTMYGNCSCIPFNTCGCTNI